VTVRVQTADFDIGAEIAGMRRGNSKVGAVASFIGVVRDLNEGDRVADMTLEHYPGMTEKALEKIIDEARSRWTSTMHWSSTASARSSRATRSCWWW